MSSCSALATGVLEVSVSEPKPLPLLKALAVSWAVVKYLNTLNVAEALSDGMLSTSERRVLLRRALSPKALEDLVEAILDAAAPRGVAPRS